MLKVSAVSFLNTKPFIYGLQHSTLGELELSLDIPSVCAAKLIGKKADIGLVPVAVLPLLEGYSVVSDYCIGAKGKVGSVMLFSNVPLTEITTILLDYHSRTSVVLARVLANKLWKISPVWKEGGPGYESSINDTTAGVVIGDRALELSGKYRFSYDLSDEWFKLTSLPFVFACWVAGKNVPPGFLVSFNEALQCGVEHIADMIETMDLVPVDKVRINAYLTENIDYHFDDNKRKALTLFLDYARELN